MGYYPMGCSNIFCIEPDEVDTTYFYILAIVSFINCLVALATIYLVLRRIFRACCTAPKADADTSETPVAVVVPCYLPNEQGIMSPPSTTSSPGSRTRARSRCTSCTTRRPASGG